MSAGWRAVWLTFALVLFLYAAWRDRSLLAAGLAAVTIPPWYETMDTALA